MKREAWKEVNIMRKKHSFKLFISIVLMCLVSIMTIAVSSDKNQGDFNSKSLKDVYVFSKKASLYEKPSVKAKQIKVIQSGDVLSVYEEKGYWLYVKTKDESGWISKFLVSDYQPRDAKVKIAQIKKSLKRNARRRASSYSSAAAARGLSGSEAVTGSIKQDLKAIEQVEKQNISEDDVKNFMRKGELKKD